MKKIFIMAAVLMMLAISTITAFAVTGDGTEQSPFLITNQAEIELINDLPSCHFKIANDIVMDGNFDPLCKEVAFTGVLDGDGHTISNFSMDINGHGGFISANHGTIKNLRIETSEIGIIAKGYTNGYNYTDDYYEQGSAGGMVYDNFGLISNCKVNGKITGIPYKVLEYGREYYYGDAKVGGISVYNSGNIENCSVNADITGLIYCGGIVADNGGTVSKCRFSGNIEGSNCVGGICGSAEGSKKISECIVTANITGNYYCGGIAGDFVSYNYDLYTIENSCFIGSLSGTKVGGIVGSNGLAEVGSINMSNISNCYAAVQYGEYENAYGIAYNHSYNRFDGEMKQSGTSENCYYDKTVSGLTETESGSPKSTIAMKTKALYQGWDFENVWGIDENINNGYPYLLWEYEDEEKTLDYTINEITIKDMSGNTLQEIPTGTFLATVSFTNVSSSADTVIILAQYTDAGAFKGLMYIQTEDVPTGSTIKLSIPVDSSNGDVAKLKAFCWESFSSLTPMGNSASFPAEQ